MTTATTPLPQAKDVRELLEGMLGRGCDFSDGTSTGTSGRLVGTYVDDSLVLRAVVAFDLPLAAWAGAAIGLLPPGGARDAVDDKALPATLRENTGEVLNVLASLFNAPGTPHLRLHTTHAPEQAPPADVAAVLARTGGRVDWAVAVKGYGSGQLAFVLA